MKTLNADDILKAQDVTIQPVEVPEWGGQVYVRQFSAKVREELDALIRRDDETVDVSNIRCRVIALAACDETGKLLFTAEQAAALAEKSNTAIDRVYDVAAALNKLRQKDTAGEKKESATPPSAASPTA